MTDAKSKSQNEPFDYDQYMADEQVCSKDEFINRNHLTPEEDEAWHV